MSRVLVLGGARSGKSAFAESLHAGTAELDYLAASSLPADDHEWAARVAAHRLRRPATWRTVETADIARELGAGNAPAIFDSVTSWLTRAMDECGSWDSGPDNAALRSRVDALVEAWTATGRDVVAVSDEVGLGIVPEAASARLFRDTLGTLNQRLAAAADTVYFVVAGIPRRLT